MEIIQIVGFGLTAMILALTVRKFGQEFSAGISICASVIIFLFLLPRLAAVLALLRDIAEGTGTDLTYIMVVFKIVGISYISEFGAQLCIDAGEGAIASKIELAGKVLIMAASAPILIALLQLIQKLLP